MAVEDLLLLARTLPAGDDVKLVVREVAARVARAPARFRHLALLETNRGFVVNPTMQGAVVTLPTGIVATVRLSPDYPIAAPAIEGTTTAISESPSPAGAVLHPSVKTHMGTTGAPSGARPSEG